MAKVQINYKSGQSMIVKCDAFTIRNGTEFEWSGMSPRPLLFGADNVESVWVL